MNELTRNSLYIVAIFVWFAWLGAAQAESDQSAVAIPSDVTYSIISESEFRHFKRSIDVRLNKKVSEEVLRAIAWKLKKLEGKKYDRTFIAYILPDMKVGSGAWATTHFDPDLEVQILGLTSEEEEKMTQEAMSQSRDIVGIWLDDRPYVGSTLTIYRENGKLYLKMRHKDGSGSTDEMTESHSAIGTRLVEKDGNPHGEYFILDSKEDLHAGGNEGLFLKYKKLQ